MPRSADGKYNVKFSFRSVHAQQHNELLAALEDCVHTSMHFTHWGGCQQVEEINEAFVSARDEIEYAKEVRRRGQREHAAVCMEPRCAGST